LGGEAFLGLEELGRVGVAGFGVDDVEESFAEVA